MLKFLKRKGFMHVLAFFLNNKQKLLNTMIFLFRIAVEDQLALSHLIRHDAFSKDDDQLKHMQAKHNFSMGWIDTNTFPWMLYRFATFHPCFS